MRAPIALAAAVVVAAVLVAASTPARAAPPMRVVLLRSPPSDAVTTDAMARVRGELTAAAFEVTVIPQEPRLDIRTALETVGRDLEPLATFAIVRAADPDTAEIWVCDRLAGRSVIQSVRLDGAGVPVASRSVVLAVEAVELLKASLAERWLASARPAVPPPPPAAGPAGPAPSDSRSGLAVEAAVGWLDSLGDVPGVWQPMVRVSWGARGWGGRVAAGGLGAAASLRAPSGSAQIRQDLAVLEVVREFRGQARLQPFVSAGAGALRAHVAGTGAPTYTGVTSTSWSALATAGAGLSVLLAPYVALAVDAQVMLACPYTTVRLPTVRLPNVDGANLVWPALLVSVGLRAGFP